MDQADYNQFRAAFGKDSTHALYRIILDVNADGMIGIPDFAAFRARYSEVGIKYGDLNADGVVGIADFGLFRSSFGKSAGDTGYIAAADFNGDNMVDTIDFDAFRAVFGS